MVMDKISVVADTIHGQISLSAFEKDVIATTLFNRLHGIYQNSTAYMTFPTNRTKRVEHSFGTMYLCGNFLSNAICNSLETEDDLKKFFDEANNKINDILNRIKENIECASKLGQRMKQIPANYSRLKISGGIYNRVLPSNIQSENHKIFIILFESIRIAALLHDVGHPPYSHITEFALKNIYNDINANQKENSRIKEFNEIIEPLISKDKELHEEMGNSIANALLKESIEDISSNQAKNTDIYDKQLFRLIVAEMAQDILKEADLFYKDLHSIISGTLDGDRLDYVSRDPKNSGFSTGIIEYERLISSVKLVEKDGRFLFCPSTSVVNTIEDYLMRRWNMYRNIIYHHRVVKTDYLLQKCIEKLAIQYLEDEKLDTDQSGYILPYNISGLWKALRKEFSVLEQGYSINQWDDAWLMAVLKKEYFGTVINEESTLNKMLTELLTHKKRYASLIKRKEEFEVIDKAVAETIAKKETDIKNLISNLRKENKKKETEDDNYFDIEGYIKKIQDIVQKSISYNQNNSLTTNGGFILNEISKSLKIGKISKLEEIITDIVTNYDNENYFVVFKLPKTGTNKDLYICKKYYESKNKQIQTLNEISDVHAILNNNLKYAPFFFIYVDTEKTKLNNFDFNNERIKIGKAIATGIYECIKEQLKPYMVEA